MDEQKLEFCLKLGQAVPTSRIVLQHLESLRYIQKFPRIDIENQRQVDIYCVLIPFTFRINDDILRLVLGHTFHTFDNTLILPKGNTGSGNHIHCPLTE